MKIKGVVFKLFIVNLVFYIIFFTAVAAGHLWFFEKFYQHERKVDLQKKLTSFAQEYEQQKWPVDKTPEVIGSFIVQNHVQMAILDTNGNILYDNPFRIIIKTDSGGTVPIAVSFFPDIGALTQYGLQSGDHISIKGKYYEEQATQRFLPYIITKDNFPSIGSLPFSTYHEQELSEIKGTVVSLFLPEPNQWNNREGIMAAALKDWFPLPEQIRAGLNQGEGFLQEWKEPISGVNNIIFVQPIVQQGAVKQYLFAVTPLTQLGEAVGALEAYYTFFSIAGGLLLIVGLSFLFSKMVSRPLLQLNRTAKRMAKLDFTAVSSIKRSDELGSLSESLVSLSTNLEAALEELTLANEKLVNDMEYKGRMEKIQKRFVSDASHELKTPISVIKGYAEGLLDQIAQDKRDKYASTILREADRMEQLVLDMLELTQLEAGSIPLKPIVFLMDELIFETTEKMERLAKGKGLSFNIECYENSWVFADPEKMQQVLLNYLSNAIRHANENSIISIRVELANSNQIGVYVTNQGMPIPENELLLIWDRFYREENARSRIGGGTGLGLAIVKEIVQLHHQTYGVRNISDGVTFYFTLAVALPPLITGD